MAYVTQQIIKTTDVWAAFDALGKPVPKDYWLFERVTEGDARYYKFKISDGVHLFSELPYQLLNGGSARISSDGYWETFNDATQQYEKTTVKALGVDGKSAFELWQSEEGNADKTLADFFNYLKGAKGDPFTYSDFTPEQLAYLTGKSAYQVWQGLPGNEGKTIDEYLAAIKGDPFTYSDFTPEQLADLTGKSAYQVWQSQPGNEGKTVNDYLQAIKGKDGVIPVDAPSDGKTYGRKNEGWVEIVGEGSVIIPNSVVLLFIQNKDNIQAIPSDQILTAFGGEDSFSSIVDGIIADRPVFVQYEVTTGVSIFFPVLSMYGINDGINSGLAVSVNIDLSIIGDSTVCRLNISVGKQEGEYFAEGSVVFVETKATYLDLSKALDADGNFLNTIPQSFYDEIQEAFNNKTTSGLTKDDRIVPINIVKNSDDYTVSGVTEIAYGGASILIEIITLSVSSDLTLYGYKSQSALMINGDGTEALMNDGNYKRVVVLSPFTTTTLTNLPVDTYSIRVTLSAASALSFASTPAEGWECMIDIKNTGSSDITQALPNATGWQCDEESVTIAAGKIASISVRYIHGTYVVLSKGN